MDIPISINWQRWEAYLLPPDEIVFFEFLLFKHNGFGLKPFFIGRDRREILTHIKRRKQEEAIKKFAALGFLLVEEKTNEVGRVTYYHIDYTQLEKVLDRIITPQTDANRELREFVRLQNKLSKNNKGGSKKKTDEAEKRIRHITKHLNNVYLERVEMHNETATNKKTPTKLAITKPIEKKLLDLEDKFDLATIKCTAIVLFDHALKHGHIKNPLGYLTKRTPNGDYPNFNYFLNKFQQNYSHD